MYDGTAHHFTAAGEQAMHDDGTANDYLQNLYGGNKKLTKREYKIITEGNGNYLQNLYAGAHHLTAAEEQAMHDGTADNYLQNLYGGNKKLTKREYKIITEGNGNYLQNL